MITVIAPILNEIDFIKAWCENVAYADRVVVLDMGSVDGTRDILNDYPHIQVIERPDWSWYDEKKMYGGRHGFVMNYLLDQAGYPEWIITQDADELIGKDFLNNLGELRKSSTSFHRFMFYHFWYSSQLIRVRQLKKDWWLRFYPSMQIRMFRKRPWIKYDEKENHAPLQIGELGKYSPRLSEERHKDIPVYHYNYVLHKKGKNRTDEKGMNGVKLMTYFGEHPKETLFYEWWNDKLLLQS